MSTLTQLPESKEGRNRGSSGKRVHIVMNSLGDTPIEYDAGDAEAVAEAQERFRGLTDIGFRAAALSGDGSPGRLIRNANLSRAKRVPVRPAQ